MALERITNPPVLDSTGLAIVQKLEAIKNVVQPVNAGTDIDITIPSSGWSSESPYQYTYSNAHITNGSLVKVTFLEGSGTSTPLYLEFEKVANGVRFEAPAKPTNDISVRIHIFSADTTSTAATSADEVSTSAVPGASNVDDALNVLENATEELNNKIAIKDLGSFATQSAMEAAFSSELANLESGQQEQILVANSAAFGLLGWTTTWCGLIQKVGGGTGRGIVQLRTFSALPGHDIVCHIKDGSYYWDEYALNSNIANLKTFAQIYNDEITAGTSKTYTLTASTQVAMVYVNNGNGTVGVWAISFRAPSEIGKERLSTAEASTTITTSGMTFTVACTYTAKVKVVVF